MSSSPHTTELDPVAGREAFVAVSMGEATTKPPYLRYEWAPVVLGIAFAGASYPAVWAAGSAVYAAVDYVWLAAVGTPVRNGGLAVLPRNLAFSLIGAFVGLIWATFVSCLVVPVFYLFVRSLKLQANFIWLGAIAGGLVGLLAVLPLTEGVFMRPTMRPLDTALMFGMGPALTTVLGQIGGAWGARGSMRRASERLEEAVWTSPAGPSLRFSLRHLLWVSFWASLILTAIRLCQIPAAETIGLLGVWFVFQSATLWLGWWIALRLLPRWQTRRAGRST